MLRISRALFIITIVSIQAQAATITLAPKVDASAEDRTDSAAGLVRDGVFETILPLDDPYLRVTDAGSIEQRAVLEFDLSPIPPLSQIQSALLVLSMNARSDEPISVGAFGYIGDGLISSSDFSDGNLVSQAIYPASAFLPSSPTTFDATAVLTDLLASHASFAGFGLRDQVGNGPYFASSEWPEADRRPRLDIQYTVLAEPSSVATTIIALFIIATCNFWHNTSHRESSAGINP